MVPPASMRAARGFDALRIQRECKRSLVIHPYETSIPLENLSLTLSCLSIMRLMQGAYGLILLKSGEVY
jgi:hypothetical protein